MKDYEERLLKEYLELENRLIRLKYIIAHYESANVKWNCPKETLYKQAKAMQEYRDVLILRINLELLGVV